MMLMTSRRGVLQASLQATAVAATLRPALRAAQLKTLGFQLYTVRGVMPAKAQETLAAIKAAGFQEIEATYALLDGVWPAIQSTGLKPVSIHLDSKMVTQGKAEDLDPVFAGIKKKGFEYVVFPYLPEPERGGIDVIKTIAGKLNVAAGKAKAAGLNFCYHNHAFEFATEKDTTLFQVLLDNTDQKLVGIALDLFWVTVAGLEPIAEIRGEARRLGCTHYLKAGRALAIEE